MQTQQRPPASSRPARTTEVEAVRARLQEHAGEYFSDFAGERVEVALTRSQYRKMSAVFEFELTGRQSQRTVIAKANRIRRDAARLANLERPTTLDRPRLAPWIPREVSARMEYDALRVIHCHFTELGNARFATVRPLDFLQEGPALVMEKLPMKDLKSRLIRHHRLGRETDDATVLRSCRHAGEWLREFHRLRPLPHTRPRHVRRDDFVRTVGEFTEFLTETHGHASLFRSAAKLVRERAAEVLPESLPLGVLHGDYGARNLLTDASATVAGFDTRARCYGPIYEDLAYFRVMLHKDSPQRYGMGLCYPSRWADQLGDEFLSGYFAGAPIPWEAIRLFEVEALLDKWGPYALGYREASGVRRLAKRCRLEMLSRYFFRHLRRLLDQIRSSAPTSSSAGAARVAATDLC